MAAVALVRHVLKLQPGLVYEVFDGEVVDGADAGRAVLRRRGGRLGIGDQIGN
jgi:hypothetical protein